MLYYSQWIKPKLTSKPLWSTDVG